jgi:hypothetical protein
MSEDEEWVRAEDALALLGNSSYAEYAICNRAHAGLIKARAKLYIDATGRASDDAEVPSGFWSAKGDIIAQNWRTSGDIPGFTSPRAFGVTFRRLDIEQMISPAPQGANASAAKARPPSASRKVFIVDGRNGNAKNEVALFLKKIGLSAASRLIQSVRSTV